MNFFFLDKNALKTFSSLSHFISHQISLYQYSIHFILFYQPITRVQPNPTQPTWIRLCRVKLMGLTIFLLITIIIKLNRKNISHVPLELTNKIYINSYSNSVINKLEWSGSMGVGGNRKRNKIVTVYEIIEFYIGRAE